MRPFAFMLAVLPLAIASGPDSKRQNSVCIGVMWRHDRFNDSGLLLRPDALHHSWKIFKLNTKRIEQEAADYAVAAPAE